MLIFKKENVVSAMEWPQLLYQEELESARANKGCKDHSREKGLQITVTKNLTTFFSLTYLKFG